MDLMNKGIERKGCALVAAYNAAQFAGVPVSYKEVSENARAFCGFRNNGLKTDKVTKLFRCLNIPTRRLKKNTPLNVALNALWDGHAVVFGYRDKDRRAGHAVVVTPDFKILNPDSDYQRWNDLFNGICTGKVTYNAWIVGKP